MGRRRRQPNHRWQPVALTGAKLAAALKLHGRRSSTRSRPSAATAGHGRQLHGDVGRREEDLRAMSGSGSRCDRRSSGSACCGSSVPAAVRRTVPAGRARARRRRAGAGATRRGRRVGRARRVNLAPTARSGLRPTRGDDDVQADRHRAVPGRRSRSVSPRPRDAGAAPGARRRRRARSRPRRRGRPLRGRRRRRRRPCRGRRSDSSAAGRGSRAWLRSRRSSSRRDRRRRSRRLRCPLRRADARRRAAFVPTDPLVPQQWYLIASGLRRLDGAAAARGRARRRDRLRRRSRASRSRGRITAARSFVGGTARDRAGTGRWSPGSSPPRPTTGSGSPGSHRPRSCWWPRSSSATARSRSRPRCGRSAGRSHGARG